MATCYQYVSQVVELPFGWSQIEVHNCVDRTKFPVSVGGGRL